MSQAASKIRSRTPREPERAELQLVAVLHALADPLRLDIVRFLSSASGEHACNQCRCPQVAKSTIAHHFKVLRQAGILSSREVGTSLQNSLRLVDLEARFPGLLPAILRTSES